MEKKYISIDIGEQRSKYGILTEEGTILNGMRWRRKLIRADRRS